MMGLATETEAGTEAEAEAEAEAGTEAEAEPQIEGHTGAQGETKTDTCTDKDAEAKQLTAINSEFCSLFLSMAWPPPSHIPPPFPHTLSLVHTHSLACVRFFQQCLVGYTAAMLRLRPFESLCVVVFGVCASV